MLRLQNQLYNRAGKQGNLFIQFHNLFAEMYKSLIFIPNFLKLKDEGITLCQPNRSSRKKMVVHQVVQQKVTFFSRVAFHKLGNRIYSMHIHLKEYPLITQ